MRRLTILGGGGFRTPLVVRAVLHAAGGPLVDEICLHDVDSARLAAVRAVIDQQAQRSDTAPPGSPARHTGDVAVRATTDLEDALGGASFVFSAVRVGGLAGRIADERVSLDHGVLGQETTGPGGLAFALRTVPVAVEVARRVAAHAPDAWVINFTNPAGLVTEAMQGVLGDRVVGICDSPLGLARRVARRLGTPLQGAGIRYAGLNHLGWLTGLEVDGVDRLPEFLADERLVSATEEGQVFGVEWLRSLGCVPNEYLHYWYSTREAIAAASAGGATRGEFLLRQQGAFYQAVAERPADALSTWEAVLRERNETYMARARADHDREEEDVESGGYEGVAVALMAALAGDEEDSLILNVRNDRAGEAAIPGLPDAAVVEVPCRVGAAGPVPLLPGAPLRGHQIGLVQQVKEVEQLAIRAALERSPELAVQALALHPLVDSIAVARSLLDGYRARVPSLDAVFRD